VKAKELPDVTSSEFKSAAYGFYAELRKGAPVYAAKLPTLKRPGSSLVTRM